MIAPPSTPAPLLGEPLPVELMNTVWADGGGGHDELVERSGLRGWLAAVASRPELADLRLTGWRDPSALTEFRSLRDALRVLAAEHTVDSRPIAGHSTAQVKRAVAELNRTSAQAPAWPELRWTADGPEPRVRSDATSVSTARARIAGDAIRLFGERAELRACYGPGCVLYFVRNHPRREWCSAACGNRARVARHYARHHAR